MVYDSTEAAHVSRLSPGFDEELVRLAKEAWATPLALRDSLNVDAEYVLFDSFAEAGLAPIPLRERESFLTRTYSTPFTVVCLTPAAQVGDQALVFMVIGSCGEPVAWGGVYAVLRRTDNEWRVVAQSSTQIN